MAGNYWAVPAIEGIGQAPDRCAQGPPFVKRRWNQVNANMQGRAALRRKMKTIARRATRKACGQRRRPALEVGARAANRVGIDNHPGVAKGDVLVASWSLNGLIVYAG